MVLETFIVLFSWNIWIARILKIEAYCILSILKSTSFQKNFERTVLIIKIYLLKCTHYTCFLTRWQIPISNSVYVNNAANSVYVNNAAKKILGSYRSFRILLSELCFFCLFLLVFFFLFYFFHFIYFQKFTYFLVSMTDKLLKFVAVESFQCFDRFVRLALKWLNITYSERRKLTDAINAFMMGFRLWSPTFFVDHQLSCIFLFDFCFLFPFYEILSCDDILMLNNFPNILSKLGKIPAWKN